MIEPEVAYLEHEGNMQASEEFVAYLVGRALEKRRVELDILERDTRTLEATAQGGFPSPLIRRGARQTRRTR
jgi:asparaginyl-tRNA synthetase